MNYLYARRQENDPLSLGAAEIPLTISIDKSVIKLNNTILRIGIKYLYPPCIRRIGGITTFSLAEKLDFLVDYILSWGQDTLNKSPVSKILNFD
jgi:hypothetical protein